MQLIKLAAPSSGVRSKNKAAQSGLLSSRRRISFFGSPA
jgi:hypothetical protein